MKKNGITIVSISIIILVLFTLASVISVSASRTIKMSKLRVFATEISTVQSELDDYLSTSSLDCTYGYINLDLTNINQNILSSQFENENIVDNQLTLIELDLSKLGINNTQYGNKNDPQDIYAVSEDTLRVYYIKGYSLKDKVYYTYYNDLAKMFDITANTEAKNIISFKPNTIKMTNVPVSVIVKIPKIFSNIIITATQSVNVPSTFEEKGEYLEYIINSNSLPTNYIITVNYNDNLNNSKKVEYEVKNFDNIAPVISELTNDNIKLKESTTGNEAYIYNINITDNTGIINLSKYDDLIIKQSNAKDYFKEEGITFTGDTIKLISKSSEYTIYAEDLAGNYSISTLIIPNEIATKIDIKGILNYTRTYDLKTTGYAYNNPPIPAGFKAVDVGITLENPTPTKWIDRALDYNKGLVIEDSLGNQFVWVPVENVADYDYAYLEAATYFKIPEPAYRESQSTIKSDVLPKNVVDETIQINKYGGFYISRYEIGATDKIAHIIYNNGTNYTGTESDAFGRVVSKKGSIVWTNISYTNAKINAENYINNDFVASGLMNLLQLHQIAKWVAKTKTPNGNTNYDIVTAKNYGNFSDNEYPANIPGSGTRQVSGFSEYWKVNNIYDILGNAYEMMSTGAFDDLNQFVGMAVIQYYTLVGYWFSNIDIENHNQYISFGVGFRIVLYIN